MILTTFGLIAIIRLSGAVLPRFGGYSYVQTMSNYAALKQVTSKLQDGDHLPFAYMTALFYQSFLKRKDALQNVSGYGSAMILWCTDTERKGEGQHDNSPEVSVGLLSLASHTSIGRLDRVGGPVLQVSRFVFSPHLPCVSYM